MPIKHYSDFLKAIPEEYWCQNPVFYYNPNRFCWDALGFLGEKIHSSTNRTKYLELCFAQVDLSIARVLDNEIPLFQEYKSNKARFLAALSYVEERLEEKELKQILIKSKILSDERNKFR